MEIIKIQIEYVILRLNTVISLDQKKNLFYYLEKKKKFILNEIIDYNLMTQEQVYS